MTKPAKFQSRLEGSFAAFTIRERLPGIIRTISADRSDKVAGALSGLVRAILDNDPVDPSLLEAGGWWSSRAAAAKGTRWLSWPFFDLEFMFYRAVNQLTAEETSDPFASIKRRAAEAVDVSFLSELGDPRSPFSSQHSMLAETVFANDYDLSQKEGEKGGHARSEERLLIDERARWAEDCLHGRNVRLNYVLDNAGRELAADLCFVVAALESGGIAHTTLHFKPYPMFVSDATLGDYDVMIGLMEASPNPKVNDIARRLRGFADDARLTLVADADWGEARHFDELTPTLVRTLQESDALIFKGDLNYRRFVQDRSWRTSTPIAIATAEVPFEALSLRTLKSEALVGLSPALATEASGRRPRWQTDGFFGVAQILGTETPHRALANPSQ